MYSNGQYEIFVHVPKNKCSYLINSIIAIVFFNNDTSIVLF